jgi:DNA-binding transcriptional LysR family regulator
VDRFDNMRVFAKVVESGSFAGAAARLGISGEHGYPACEGTRGTAGARLLNRTTRKVSLTETGRAYYERCTRLLADLEETEQAVSDMHAAPRGSCASMPRRLSAYCSWRPPGISRRTSLLE